MQWLLHDCVVTIYDQALAHRFGVRFRRERAYLDVDQLVLSPGAFSNVVPFAVQRVRQKVRIIFVRG